VPGRDRRGADDRAERLAILAQRKDEVPPQYRVARVTESGLPHVYINQVGGQDELVFDGASFGLNADCTLGFQLAAFRELVTTVHFERTSDGWRCTDGPLVVAADDPDQEDYTACMQGLRDYVGKERLCRRGARPLRRHRLGAGGGACGRCARA